MGYAPNALMIQLKRKIPILRRYWITNCLLKVILHVFIAATPLATKAQTDTVATVLPDSSNFVTASLLTISPTNEVYSVFGHTAIRMECPVHQLDYVFTFESDPSVNGFVTFFAGKAKARFIAVPTQEFIESMRGLGRGVKQYELNLTLHEEQELWRNLDNDMVEGANRKFNLLVNNCVSMTVLKLHQSCINEHIEWGKEGKLTLLNNGDYVRQCVGRSPWAEFLFITFMGSICEESYGYESRLCPENIITELKKASFVSEEDEKRPVLTGEEKELLPVTGTLKETKITPMLLFVALLVFTCLLTFAEWRWNWVKPAHIYDVILFVTQTLLGLGLLYITFVSELLGRHFNWYLIPFNPLPFVFWLCLRKQKNYGRVYLFYTLVLVAFIALTPFLSQLDVPHQLITVVLSLRCISKYLEFIKEKNKR